MRNISLILLLGAFSVPLATVSGPAMAEDGAASKYSVDASSLGTLIDDPAAKAVLDKHLPGLADNPQIQMARAMTLKQLQGFAGDMLTDDALAKVQADLEKLPAKS